MNDETLNSPSPSKTRVALLALGVLALGALVAFLAIRFQPEAQRQQPEVPPPLVQVMEVSTRPVALNVHSQGAVEPRTSSTLVAQVAGRIVDVHDGFADGGLFRRGEVLVTIEARDYELALEDAEAALAQARTRLQREQAEAEVAREEWEELGGESEPSPLLLREPQLAEARAAVAAAEAAVQRAELNLSRTRVEAPFDGRVRQKQADLGQYVTPGAPLASVFGTAVAEIRLPVPKEELAFLEVGVGWSGDGGPVVMLAGELGGRRHTWPARVVRTGAEIDTRTRMLDVFARVDDPLGGDATPARHRGHEHGGDAPPPLPMGLFVEADIAGRTAAAAAVLPRRALRPAARTRGDEVLVVDGDGRLRYRQVEVLRAVGDRVVVGTGLTDGDRVVVSRLEEAVDGMEVRTETWSPEWTPEPDGDAGRTEGRL